MKKSVLLCALVALTALLGSRQAWAVQPSGSTLMVIPARYTVVQFAFDVAQLRSVYLVSYDRPATSSETQLYAWDNGKAEWLPIEESDIRSGSLFHVKPARTVLVGDTSTLPAALADAAKGGAAPLRITSLNLADMANSLDKVLHFRPREWKWLANRYDFELEDTNYERRRWGRYGPPGESREARERATPMPQALQSEMTEVLEPARAVSMPTSRQTVVIPVAATPAPAADPVSQAVVNETVAVPALEKGNVPVVTESVTIAVPADVAPENK